MGYTHCRVQPPDAEFNSRPLNAVLLNSVKKNCNAMPTSSLSIRERREAIVQEHIAAEKAHDISRILATFHHPRYELAPFSSVTEGNTSVHEFLAGLFASFPDFDIEAPQVHHTGDTVEIKCVVTGNASPLLFRSASQRAANRGSDSRHFPFRGRLTGGGRRFISI